MRSKTNIQTSWNSSENTNRCMFSGRKKNNLEVACWDRPDLIPHAVPLFISILQRFDSTYLKMNETISIFRCQRIWFHAQMIHLFHSTIVCSAPTGSSSDFSLRQILLQCSLARIANPALQSALQECHFFPKGSVMLIRRLLIFLLTLINALFLHCWRPLWASTFLDIKLDAAMQQRFNRRARSWIFEWISLAMLDSAFTPKVRSKFYKHDRYEGPHSCTSLRCSWHWKKLWDDLAPCQCLSNGYHKNSSLRFLCHVTSMCREGQLLVLHFALLHLAVPGWLYLPCPRGASHPVSLTCATYWHFLFHP